MNRNQSGAISDHELNTRLKGQERTNELTVMPLLGHSVRGGAVDLRLGPRFVSLRRTATSALDPISVDSTAVARMLEERHLALGESYHLHPGELILAATLEYISLPSDLAANVTSRSSYGRVGLVIATAPYVHPGYKGCLTLELANVGSTPVVMYSGLPVAQLSFVRVHTETTRPSRYSLATGPLFPPLEQDADRLKLQRLREEYERSVRTPPESLEPNGL